MDPSMELLPIIPNGLEPIKPDLNSTEPSLVENMKLPEDSDTNVCQKPDIIDQDEKDDSLVQEDVHVNETPTTSNPALIEEPTRSNTPKSPEPNCAICLGKLENKSFTDSCFHQFCFTCLLEWSKIKAQCPLCKQAFKSIIHNVRSIEDYDQYYIMVRQSERAWNSTDGMRFRYPTTLTNERRRHRTFEQTLEFQNYRLLYAPHLHRGLNSRYPSLNRSTTSDYRQNIYFQGWWVVTEAENGRYRETSPEFYQQNPACTHRLIPWLNRELIALLPNSENQGSFVLELILALIMRYSIQSSEFYEHINPYLLSNTAHFVHEFYNFARSPYDMHNYDSYVADRYQQLENPSNPNNSSISSPDIIEVPVEGVTRNFGAKKRRFSTKPRPSKMRLRSSTHRLASRRNKEASSSERTSSPLDFISLLGIPGTSTQTSRSIAPKSKNRVDYTGISESDEDCVMVDIVPSQRFPPTVIDIISSDEELAIPIINSPEKETTVAPPKSPERPSRSNRCTYHYDYSSDSNTEPASSLNSEPLPIKKIKIKSIVGSVIKNETSSLPSTSDQSSHTSSSHKKHKKKHKHKHHHHDRRSKRD